MGWGDGRDEEQQGFVHSEVNPWTRRNEIQKKVNFDHTPSRGEALMLDARLAPYVQKYWTDLNMRTTLNNLKLVL